MLRKVFFDEGANIQHVIFLIVNIKLKLSGKLRYVL
jgi:hypothetical protein